MPQGARIIGTQIAAPAAYSLEEAAHGAHLIAASNMIRALKAVSSERGRDPREYVLVAFGGNGAIFAARMAEALRTASLDPALGRVFSSFGLLDAEVEYYFTRTRKVLLRAASPEELQEAVAALEDEARTRLTEDGFARRPYRNPAQRQPALPGPELSSVCPGGLRGSTPRHCLRWRKHSASSINAPTVTAPGSRNRSSWSASR